MRITHIDPTPNTANTSIFLVTGIFRCQIAHAGSNNASTSDITFRIPLARFDPTALMHFPWTFGFQIASLGQHWKMYEKKSPV
jgi:hypothetical protein